MDDLLSWLSTQLDHDEQVARAATSGPWSVVDGNRSIVGPDGPQPRLAGYVICSVGAYDRGLPSAADAAHIALHDPARVLRQVAVHRRVVARCADTIEKGTWYFTGDYIDEAEETLRILASIYSGRPGFDPSWVVE